MKLITVMKHVVKVLLGVERISFERIARETVVRPEIKIFYDDLDESKLHSSNNNQFKKLVVLDGVGFSGSSAVGDFLGEFSNCTSLGGVDPRENPGRGIENSYEIDFLRDPGSLLDLERICYTNVNRLKDNAINQFIEVCKNYYDNSIPIFDDYFYELSKKFVQDITSYAFKDSPMHISYIPKRMSLNDFRKIAKLFMLSILKNIPSQEFLICDNLASVGRPDNGIINEYLGDCKILMNYCDPRDVYARARLQPGNDWVPQDPEIFVKNWQQNIIPCLNDINSNTLITNFDDFCNDYENQAKKIMKFLGLEQKEHVDKFKYFNPKISINNTNVWKKLENQRPVDYIFEHLKEFCYDSENRIHYV